MANLDIRCDSTLHCKVIEGKWLEVKCKRRACGHEPGMVVLHTIDIATGEVIQTRKFADPNQRNKE